MALTAENRARKDWIKNGEMNGDIQDCITALFNALPTTGFASSGNVEMARAYMAELWLRGVSKREFIRRTGLVERQRKVKGSKGA